MTKPRLISWSEWELQPWHERRALLWLAIGRGWILALCLFALGYFGFGVAMATPLVTR